MELNSIIEIIDKCVILKKEVAEYEATITTTENVKDKIVTKKEKAKADNEIELIDRLTKYSQTLNTFIQRAATGINSIKPTLDKTQKLYEDSMNSLNKEDKQKLLGMLRSKVSVLEDKASELSNSINTAVKNGNKAYKQLDFIKEGRYNDIVSDKALELVNLKSTLDQYYTFIKDIENRISFGGK